MKRVSARQLSVGRSIRRGTFAVVLIAAAASVLLGAGSTQNGTTGAAPGTAFHVVASGGGDARGCPSADPCTLAAALLQVPHDVPISLAAGTYHGPLVINQSVTIDGAGEGETVFSGSNGSAPTSPVIAVDAGTVALNNLTVTGGNASNEEYGAGGIDNAAGFGNGGSLTLVDVSVTANNFTYGEDAAGGIVNIGTLTLDSSQVTGNTASDGDACSGGLANDGSLTLSSTVVSGNSCSPPYEYGVGGVSNGGEQLALGDQASPDSVLTIEGSTISNNQTTGTCNIFSGCTTAAGGILSGGTATVSGSTISDNTAHRSGGAIDNGNTFTVSDTTFSGNSASENGGAIDSGDMDRSFTPPTLDITNSTFSGNSANGNGGAIDSGDRDSALPPSLNVTSSTFSGNSAGDDGGAIDNGDVSGQGTLSITTSTLSGNTATRNGGAIDNGDDGGIGTVRIGTSTLSGNMAGDNGGAIDNGDNLGPGTLTVATSTLSGNMAGSDGGAIDNGDNGGSGTVEVAADIFDGGCVQNGGWTDDGFNVGTDTSCLAASPPSSDDSSVDAADLSPLADYGGPTLTMPPVAPNPAIGLIPDPNSAVVDGSPLALCPTTDQRGYTPPSGSVLCDAGAVQTEDVGSPSGSSPTGCPSGTVNCESDSTSIPGVVFVTVDSTTATASGGVGTINLGDYVADPVGVLSSATGEYIDVSLSTGSTFDSVSIDDCNLNGGTTLEWWNPQAGSWQAIVPTPTFTAGPPPCVTATLNSTSSPTLAQLTGTVFGAATTMTLNQGPPSSATVADGAGYGGQLTVSGGAGTVTYSETISGQSSDVVVTASGAISAPASLAPGVYSVGGTDTDSLGDNGTWNFALTVSPASTPPTTSTTGYREVASDGGIFSFGDAGFFGSMGGKPLNSPIVGVAATPSGQGYWLVASDGGIFSFGDAGFFGSMGGKPLNSPIVGVAATPSGQGYWLVASDGGIFSFGDAGFFGSMGGKPLNSPIVGVAATPSGQGYWLVASDGGIFSFGDAGFFGSMGGKPLNSPIVGVAATPSGQGYWLVASDGGIFSFGDAGFFGSMGGKPLNSPIVGVAATPSGQGYWLVASDGGIFSFGDAGFFGSMGGKPLNSPIVGVAAS